MAEERLFNRNFLLVLAGNFLLFFAFFTILPVLPLYMQQEYNATHTEIGVVLSLYTVTALIIRPFAGFMLDSLPRRPMQLLFYGAFFAHHRGIKRKLVDEIWEQIKGQEILAALVELYSETIADLMGTEVTDPNRIVWERG